MQIKKQLELDIEQQTGSKLGKEYIRAIYCHPDYLNSMQSTSCEMPGWKTAGKNNNFRYADDTTLMTKSEEELNSKPPEEGERGE